MIPYDKKLHFLMGGLITAGFTVVFNPPAGLFVGVAVGAFKELKDEYDYGGADLKDFFATASGALAVANLFSLTS